MLLGLERLAASVWPQGMVGRRGLPLVRLVAAVGVGAAVLVLAAANEHDPYDIKAGEIARIVAGLVPLTLAVVTACSVLRPWRGFVAVMLLTPVFDSAQIHLEIGALQVIVQTLCVVALGLGLALRDRPAPVAAGPAPVAAGPAPVAAHASPAEGDAVASVERKFGRRSWTRPDLVAAASLAALLALAAGSTALSPNVTQSATVLLHGILEPVAFGLVLVALRPNRRDLALLFVVLGVSVAIGGILNMLQTIPDLKSLAVIQANRLLVSRLTYFNVGLFGAMLAMALPMLAAAILAHRTLGHRARTLVVLCLLMLAALASLFLTFSKSAYLASSAGVLILLFLIVRSRKRRVSLVLTATLISAVVIPWPAAILQVAPPLEQAYRNAVVRLVGQSRYDSWNPATLSGRGSLLERWYATRAAAQMAIDHPLLGIGLDQFKAQYVGRYKPAEAHLELDSAHTFWPEIGAELGLPALFLVVLIFAAALLALWRVYRSPPDQLGRLLAATFLASMGGWLVVATTFDIDLYRDWRNMSSDVVMAAVLVACAFALYRTTRAAGAADAAAAAAGRAGGGAEAAGIPAV